MTETAPRRFYKRASACSIEAGGACVKLDERTLRTPAGAEFRAPTLALAQACAEEWNAQGEHIIPASMPVTQLAFAALDWTAKSRDKIVEYVTAFGETDLCCHRADAPADLVSRQAAAWDPLIAWGADALGARLAVVTGVIAAPANASALAALKSRANRLDDFRLTALSQAAGLAGSALIAFALLEGRLGAEAAFAASALDNLYALEKWGEDAEARQQLERLRHDLLALERFVRALSA
ncbi:MAG: ATP12 family protein [Hyphomonadaceae bacterium]